MEFSVYTYHKIRAKLSMYFLMHIVCIRVYTSLRIHNMELCYKEEGCIRICCFRGNCQIASLNLKVEIIVFFLFVSCVQAPMPVEVVDQAPTPSTLMTVVRLGSVPTPLETHRQMSVRS